VIRREGKEKGRYHFMMGEKREGKRREAGKGGERSEEGKNVVPLFLSFFRN
jgi:hypothetical protein